MKDIYIVTGNSTTCINGNNINILDYNKDNKLLSISMNNPECGYTISDLPEDNANVIILSFMNPNTNSPVIIDMVKDEIGQKGPEKNEDFYVL